MLLIMNFWFQRMGSNTLQFLTRQIGLLQILKYQVFLLLENKISHLLQL